jgi:GNAT superfamily N-acetyltransferase
MNENLEHKKNESIEYYPYTLRVASASDVEFLFNVSTEAMRPVDTVLNPDKVFDKEAEFKKYQEKFVPEEIQIISFLNEDVGRLRVVRSEESIYVGGIQILPEFQGKGIGSALFNDLITESNQIGIPITLEVHDVNQSALGFYTKLGFINVGHEGNKTLMKYVPVVLND